MVLFFFFKQKTAYEMRISDWSSDVCSSDLRVAGAHLGDLRCLAFEIRRIARILDRLGENIGIDSDQAAGDQMIERDIGKAQPFGERAADTILLDRRTGARDFGGAGRGCKSLVDRLALVCPDRKSTRLN